MNIDKGEDNIGNIDNEEEEYEDEEEYMDEYDKDDIPINNYKPKIYSKTAIDGIKGTGKYKEKYDSSHCMVISRINNKNFNEYSKNITKSRSILHHSKILKEYQKVLKIQKELYFIFESSYAEEKIKLKYRASEHKKFEIGHLFKLKDMLLTNPYLIIMRTTNDLYFFIKSMKDSDSFSYRTLYFFTNDEIFRLSSNRNLAFNQNNTKIEIKDCFSFSSFIPEGIFETDIKFQKVINHNTYFYVKDLEIFELKLKYYI